MASEGLIAGLAANWDDGKASALHTGQVTLKSLAAGLRGWMEGAPIGQLGRRIEEMREKVAEAARTTEADLRQGLAPELAELMEGTLAVYEGLEPVLDVLEGACADGNRAIKNMVCHLERARESLLESDRAMQAWLRAPVLRCPRCGAQPQGHNYVCPTCRVDMLYPDPESALDDSQTSAHLGPEFLVVFEAMGEVVRGDAPLSRLLATLQKLETKLCGWARMAEDEDTSNAQLTYALDTVADGARRALQGVAQMRGVSDTRRTRDLNEGWQVVFEASQQIRDAIPLIARATGAASRDHFASQARFEDAIIIEGD